MRSTTSPLEQPVDGNSYTPGATFGNSKIVHAGNATSMTLTGLDPATDYYFDVFAFNGTAATANYLTIAPLEGHKQTLATEPLSQPTSLILGGVTPSSISVSFTNASGSPAGYLVLRKGSSASTDEPLDGLTYVAGDPLGSSTVAYVGSGNSFEDIGLLPGVRYFYRVFSFNGSQGTVNYLLTSPLTSDKSTLATEPLSQPTQFSFTSIGPTSITAQFTAATGSPAGYLVLRKAGVFTSEPVLDGTEYTAGATVGTSKVVYIGSSTSFTDSGLSSGTEYSYAAYSLNGGGTTTNYLTNSPLVDVSITVPAVPAPNQGANTTAQSFLASWQQVTGAASYDLDLSRLSDFSTHVGTYPQNTTSLQHEVTGLLSGTDYFYRVRAKNTSGASDYSGAIKVTTALPPGQMVINTPQFPARLASGQALIVVEVTGGQEPRTVSIVGKGILESQMRAPVSAALRGGSSTVYEANIGLDKLDELGFEFYIEATDQTGAVKKSPSNYFIYRAISATSSEAIPFNNSVAFNGKTKTYQMFSIPYELSEKGIEELFDIALKGYKNTRWRLLHYDGGLKEYPRDFKQIKQGEGYWFNTIEKNFEIKLGEATVAQANQSSSFEIPLKKGWNQIGNPYNFPISWEKVVATYETVGDLNFYSNGGWETSDTFLPWTGAFVHLAQDPPLALPIPVTAKSNARIKQDEFGTNLDAEKWHLPIRVRVGDFSNSSGVGMHPDARASKDKYDAIALPRFMDYAEMFSSHDEFFSPKFSTDITPSANEQLWTFEIASNLDGESGEITWDEHSIQGTTGALVLIDLLDMTWVDMRLSGSYRFTHKKGRKIRIIYSRNGEINPGITLVGDAYPNPFESRITIPILVGEAGLQQIDILDAMARTVRTMTVSFSSPGMHEVEWDGRDDGGGEVSRGLLYYRVAGNSGQQVRRIVRR
jgi:hypothetical protein